MLLLVLGQSFLLYPLFCYFLPLLSCPDLSPPLWCPGGEYCECPLLCGFFHVLTCPSLGGVQEVSAPHSVTVFPCPDLSLPLLSPESEYPSLGQFLSMS